jgi:hypothetical protein
MGSNIISPSFIFGIRIEQIFTTATPINATGTLLKIIMRSTNIFTISYTTTIL